MVRPDLVIFDCDGVLVDSEVLSCGTLATLMSVQGVLTTPQEALTRFLGRSTAAIAEDFTARTGRPLPADFLPTFRMLVAERMRCELTAIPGVAQVLADLTAAGVPFCLASSSERERIDLALTVTGLAPYFEGRVFNAAMVARGKPAPDLFLHAAAALGADPARCLVIEDSPAGVEAGLAAGMAVWGFIGGGHYPDKAAAAEMLAGAGVDRVLTSMAEFGANGGMIHGIERDREVTP